MHEHLLSDARALAPDEDYLLDSEELAVRELGLAGAEGLSTVVDPTAWGFGGPAPRLPEVSRASGVQIVAVLRTQDGGWRVVTPCGLCRELISDYAPDANVIDYDVNRSGQPVQKVPVRSLLPGKTTRRWQGAP